MHPHTLAEESWIVDYLLDRTDEELDEYIRAHRGPGGLPRGTGESPKEKKRRLHDRIRTRLKQTALDEIDNGLLDVLAHPEKVTKRFKSPTPSPEPEPDDSIPEIDRNRHFEKIAFDALVEDHGRPLYPLHLMKDISEHADDYYELVRPWKMPFIDSYDIIGTHPWQVFQKQIERWRYFRCWQRDNRGLGLDSRFYSFSSYVTRERAVDDLIRGEAWPDELDADHLKSLRENWHKYLERFEKARARNKESGCETLAGYSEAMHRRLARHGINHSFSLKQDPYQQDEMTTWLEYAGFEHWRVDELEECVKSAQLENEEAGRKLEASGVLYGYETLEYVRKNLFHVVGESLQSRTLCSEPVAKARLELHTPFFDIRDNEEPLTREHKSAWKAALSKFNAAKQMRMKTGRRLKCVVEFQRAVKGQKRAEETLEHHRRLAAWVKDQIAVVAAELATPKRKRPRSAGAAAEEEEEHGGGAEQPSRKSQKRDDDDNNDGPRLSQELGGDEATASDAAAISVGHTPEQPPQSEQETASKPMPSPASPTPPPAASSPVADDAQDADPARPSGTPPAPEPQQGPPSAGEAAPRDASPAPQASRPQVRRSRRVAGKPPAHVDAPEPARKPAGRSAPRTAKAQTNNAKAGRG